jgi:hypothetical protein
MPRQSTSLVDLVRGCCETLLGDPGLEPVHDRLRTRLDELHQPLRVAVAGHVSAGKSTMVNALIGRRLADTGTTETTTVNAWFAHGRPEKVLFRRTDGGIARAPVPRGEERLQPPDDLDRDAQDAITFVLDEPLLEHLTVIDTPGLFSPNVEKSDRADAMIAARTVGAARRANALIYLTQEVPGSAVDDRQLQAFQSLFGGLAGKTPINAVLVLSKVDEKWDPSGEDTRSPFDIAADLVSAHGQELWKRVWTTQPLIGHLAELSRTDATFSAQELEDVRRLAGFPHRRRLLESERAFERAGVPVERGRALRMRLGAYGLDRALTLAEAGRTNGGELRDALLAGSGLPELMQVLSEVFADRADLLRCESVLSATEQDALTQAEGIDREAANGALRHVESVRLSSGAGELRRLHALRLVCDDETRRLQLSDKRREELRRLLAPGEPAERLGLAEGTPTHELAQTAVTRRRWWRTLENTSPISPPLASVAEVADEAYRDLADGLGRGLLVG